MKKKLIHIIIFILIFNVFKLHSQNSVVVNAIVIPPYSSDLTYYIDHDDKLLINFTNTSSNILDVYIQGRLIGDNGVEIRTDPNYKMPFPLTLSPGMTYKLDKNNIQDVFSENNLVFNGITSQELEISKSLPEGNYQFCFEVYDYNTDVLLSDNQSGCSNYFSIIYKDPPIITYPSCGSEISVTQPQSILISWTPSVGATPNVRYRLIMVEMHSDDRNPTDALMSADPADYFIEEDDLTVPQLYIGPAYPDLNIGNSYAFIVQAYDPDNQIQFNNNGTSEVCWFTYKSPLDDLQEEDDIVSAEVTDQNQALQDYLEDFVMLPSTQIKGRLLYQLGSEAHPTGMPGNAQAMESAGKNEKWNRKNTQQTQNNTVPYYGSSQQNNGQGNNNNNLNTNNFSLNNYQYYTADGNNLAQQLNMPPPLGSGVMNANLFSLNGAKALPGVKVKLVARFTKKTDNGLSGVIISPEEKGYAYSEHLEDYRFYDLMGNVVSVEQVRALIDKTVAVATTDNSGNYTFNFRQDFFTGAYISVYGLNASGTPSLDNYAGYISLKLEAENMKFCSPDVDIFALPGDRLQIPDQVALIKDYEVKVKVSVAYDAHDDNPMNNIPPDYDTKPKAMPGGTPLSNVKLRILRDVQKMKNENKAILLAEGSQDGKIIENANGKFKVVFEGMTNQNGEVDVKHLVKRWKNIDGEKGTPYYYSVQTRPDNPDNEIEFSDKNFAVSFGEFFTDNELLPDNVIQTSFDNADVFMYNSQYKNEKANEFNIETEALRPEIKGHLMAATNLENIGVSDIMVKLYKKERNDKNEDVLINIVQGIGKSDNDWVPDLSLSKIYSIEKFVYTNESGFFRIPYLPVKTDNSVPYHPAGNGPFRRIQIDSKVYKRIVWPPMKSKNGNQPAPAYNLLYGDLKYLKLQLEPKHLLYGEVVNEQGESVPAYIRLLPNNPYVKTEKEWEYDNHGEIHSFEKFSLPVADNNNEIEIIPLSNQYFQDTVRLNTLPDNNHLKITVKKKLHRIVIRVKDYKTENPVKNALVVVGDSLAAGHTNDKGNILLEFASPGEQFVFKITSGNYSPVQKIVAIPVSAHWNKVEKVYLSPAKSISGYVYDKKTHKALKNALVFTEIQNTGGQSLYLNAHTDNKGYYTLKGIPYNYQNIFVHIVKEGKNPSYIGMEKKLKITDDMVFVNGILRPVRYDFELEPADADLSNIWGFPAVIEKVIKQNGTIKAVSGYLYNLPADVHLQTLNKDEKIYFNNLNVHVKNGEIKPNSSYFYTQKHKLPVKLEGGFTGNLANKEANYTVQLMVANKNEKAFIKGVLKLDLSSFNFAYDFHGNLYLGNDTLQHKIKIFDADIPSVTPIAKKYYIFDLKYKNGSLKPEVLQNYKIFGFNASSDFANTYYYAGKINISTTLHTNIPLPNGNSGMDLKIKVGDVVITRDDISLKTSNTQFEFNLEKWKVRSTGTWYFDKNRDAIVLSKAQIQTGLGVNAGVKNLLIRPHALREGEFDIGEGLTLGGIVPLKTAPGLKPVFNYDAGVGHYRISMTGSTDQPAVWAENLPAMEGKLEFLSLDLLSDNSTESGIGGYFRFHHLIDVFVDQTVSGNGFFTLAGMPEMGIPNMITGQARMTYYKENGQLKFRMEPLNTKVDCNANTLFVLDQDKTKQKLQNKLFTSYGTFKINPPAGESGAPLLVQGKLVKKPGETYIDVLDQDIKIGRETMHISEGKISVVSNTWNELHYKAYTRSTGLDDNNEMEYVVHGGIEVSGDKIEMNKIETPFGDFSMAYLFAPKALVGHLTINKKISTGYATVNSGMLDMRFDPAGFYISLLANMDINGVPCDGGFVGGYYNENLDPVMAGVFGKMHKKPEAVSDGIKGFFFMGESPVVDKTVELKIIDIYIVGAVGAYIGANFQGKDEVIGGGYGYVFSKGGVNIYPCGFVGVENTSWVNMEIQYLNKEVTMCGCGTTEYSVHACGLEGSLGLLAKFRLSSDKNNSATLRIGGSCPSNLCNENN